MLSKDEKERILERIKNSPFNKPKYSVDLPLCNFFGSLALYTHGYEDDSKESLTSNPDRFFEAVPAFQRDNDKWSESMQVSFIENIISGYRTTIALYDLRNAGALSSDLCDCKILDGLQRLTAIYAFLTGRIKAFGYTYAELREAGLIRSLSMMIGVNIYSFKNEADAVDFYIQMNENITHAPQDIEKARKYLQEQLVN